MKELLSNKQEFNAFCKTLHSMLDSNPNYKVPKSWNSLSAEIAVAIGESHDIESDGNFNVNTLHKLYKDKPANCSNLLYSNIINSIFKGVFRDYATNIKKAIADYAETGDTDLYNVLADLTDGEVREDVETTIESLYNPKDPLNRERLSELRSFYLKMDEDRLNYYHNMYSNRIEHFYQKEQQNDAIALYTLINQSLDLLLSIFRDIGELFLDLSVYEKWDNTPIEELNQKLCQHVDENIDFYEGVLYE